MSNICADKIQCGTIEQSISPCAPGYVGTTACQSPAIQPKTLPATGGNEFVIAFLIFLLFLSVGYVLAMIGLWRSKPTEFSINEEALGKAAANKLRKELLAKGYVENKHLLEDYRSKR